MVVELKKEQKLVGSEIVASAYRIQENAHYRRFHAASTGGDEDQIGDRNRS